MLLNFPSHGDAKKRCKGNDFLLNIIIFPFLNPLLPKKSVKTEQDNRIYSIF